MKTGLLGRKLGHSYSPQIHHLFGDDSYQLYELEPDQLQNFLQSSDFSGVNVTIPYKKAVIPFCDELTEMAQKIGAVNTIVRCDDGTLVGHNTDHFGFLDMIRHSGIDPGGKKVLVLGSGGASATAQQVLKELGAKVMVISRRGENNYCNLNKHSDASIIVNCTPVGMYPNTGESPVDLQTFPLLEGVLDMIYNPSRTRLLMDAQLRGLKTENGLWMLVAQAKESAEWFRRSPLPQGIIEIVYQKMRRQMENIVLIGMPGCGKSTVGRLVAQLMQKEFVDADEEIVKEAGCTIPEIFAKEGEQGFRFIETKVLEKLGKQTGLVIATGGGCVTREENYPLLHQNATILWLKRDLDLLPTDGRPLSQQNNLSELFRVRRPLYEAFSDLCVENIGSPAKTAKIITQMLQGGQA